MPFKALMALTAEFCTFCLLLFGGAGTLVWPQAWVMLGLFFVCSGVVTFAIARNDRALLDERMKPPFQKGQPLWPHGRWPYRREA